MTDKRFSPELNKSYHVHVEGLEQCLEGTVIALTRTWFVIEDVHGDEQALPMELVTSSREIKKPIREEMSAEMQAKMAAIKTLFPDMPDELLGKLATLTDRLTGGDLEIHMLSRTGHGDISPVKH